jgi:hypothetical protein
VLGEPIEGHRDDAGEVRPEAAPQVSEEAPDATPHEERPTIDEAPAPPEERS